MRLFAALPFPATARAQVHRFAISIAPAFDRARPSWVAEQNLHLTLHFFGELDDRRASELRALLDGTASKCPPLRITTGGLSVLPSLRAPRVLFIAADVQPTEPLHQLVRSVRKIALDLGAEADSRPWTAHLTLARLKEPWAPDLRSLPPPPALSFELDAFELLSSRLRPDGAEYSRVARFSLGGASF